MKKEVYPKLQALIRTTLVRRLQTLDVSCRQYARITSVPESNLQGICRFGNIPLIRTWKKLYSGDKVYVQTCTSGAGVILKEHIWWDGVEFDSSKIIAEDTFFPVKVKRLREATGLSQVEMQAITDCASIAKYESTARTGVDANFYYLTCLQSHPKMVDVFSYLFDDEVIEYEPNRELSLGGSFG